MTHSAFTQIGACVFDAYGTLFDFHSAVARGGAALGDKAQAVSQLWREKQIEYTWLRNLMGAYVDFWQITGDGLDYALAAHGVDDRVLRDQLMELYLNLNAYPEVAETLARLRAGGQRTRQREERHQRHDPRRASHDRMSSDSMAPSTIRTRRRERSITRESCVAKTNVTPRPWFSSYITSSNE